MELVVLAVLPVSQNSYLLSSMTLTAKENFLAKKGRCMLMFLKNISSFFSFLKTLLFPYLYTSFNYRKR